MATTLQFCRVCARTDIGSRSNNRSGALAPPRRRPVIVRCSGEKSPSSAAAIGAEFDAKLFRHNLTRSDNYNRRGFGHKEETLELMNQEYTSKIFIFLFQIKISLLLDFLLFIQ